MEITTTIKRLGSETTDEGVVYHAQLQVVPQNNVKLKCGGVIDVTRNVPFDNSYAFGKTVTVSVSETAS